MCATRGMALGASPVQGWGWAPRGGWAAVREVVCGRGERCSRRQSLVCLAVAAGVFALVGVVWMSLESWMLVAMEDAVTMEALVGRE
jgi:hypothetical protein